MLMDLEYYADHLFFNGNERRLQHFLTVEHIGNLLLTQSTLEAFPEDLVLLLLKALSKYIQVTIVQPARLMQQIEHHGSVSTSTLSNNQSPQTLRKERTVFTAVFN